MSYNTTRVYPTVHTIVVPENVTGDHIGLFVSARASTILTNLEDRGINWKSLMLRPVSERLYTLTYDTTRATSIPESFDLSQEVDLSGFNFGERGSLAADTVANRNTKGLGRTHAIKLKGE